MLADGLACKRVFASSVRAEETAGQRSLAEELPGSDLRHWAAEGRKARAPPRRMRGSYEANGCKMDSYAPSEP